MKKTMLLLIGLFTLVACSEDVVPEATDVTQDEFNAPLTFDPAIPYESPYDFFIPDDSITYIFINNTTDLELRFKPIIQLCYYDGANDLNHWTHNLAVTTNYPIFTFVPGWKEYDHTVASEMMYFPPLTTETITTIPGMNLPADPTGPTTATGQYFSFSVPMTSNEIDLYTQYGKLAAIEGMVIDPITNVMPLSTAIRFPFGGPTGPTSPTGPWQPVPLAPNLVYHQNTLEVCMLNVAGGWYGLPSERIFGYNSKNYKWSAYTTLSEVVVVLEEI